MAANSFTSVNPSHDKDAGPSVPPPQATSEVFPSLARATTSSQAKKRRYREVHRRPYQPSITNNTAFSVPTFGNVANSGSGHSLGDMWPGFQSQSVQPMTAQQSFQAHVPRPDTSYWQQGVVSSVFPPGSAPEVSGSRHVENPTHQNSVIQSNSAQPLGGGHVWPPHVPSFLSDEYAAPCLQFLSAYVADESPSGKIFRSTKSTFGAEWSVDR